MSDVTREQDPKNFVFQFYRTLMMSQCQISFSMLTAESQKAFLAAIHKVMIERKPEATKSAGIGHPEIRILVDNNDSFVMKFFWRRFYQSSRCHDMIYNGLYSNENERPESAEVHVVLPSEEDKEDTVVFKIIRKGSVWKLAFVESGCQI